MKETTLLSNSVEDRYPLHILTHSDCLNEYENNTKVLNSTTMHSSCQEENYMKWAF